MLLWWLGSPGSNQSRLSGASWKSNLQYRDNFHICLAISIQYSPLQPHKEHDRKASKSETSCKHYVEHIVIVIMRNKSRKLNFNSKINIKINRNLPTHQIHKLFSPNNHLLLSVKQFRLNSEKTCLLSVQSNYTPIVSLFFFFFL